MSRTNSVAPSLVTTADKNESTAHSASEDFTKGTYWDHWGTEIQANGWKGLLQYTPRQSNLPISILDISSVGDITEWQIDLPVKGQSTEMWIHFHRPKLRSRGLEDKTRLILFDEAGHVPVRELIGLHYNIEPAFFRDIAHSVTIGIPSLSGGQSSSYSYDHQLPEFMMGSSPRHLNFCQGWTGKIQKSFLPGPKTVGKLLRTMSLPTQTFKLTVRSYIIDSD